MNKTKFLQTDSRWGSLGYPKKPWYIKNCGCGEVSIANIIIEMEKYKNYTPKTIQPYCKQFAAPNGNGTYFSGIPKMMEHYGLTEVKEHATMSTLWTELAKGNRVAIYLMGNKVGGSKRVKWTSGGHFVCSVGYKYENGKHYVYVKDSYSNSSLRNGWITYEENMKNDVLRVWSGKLYIEPAYYPSTPYTGTLPSGTVKKGSKGNNTKAVQAFLNWCINAKLAVDGNCGNLTDKAIRKYQTQYKLKVDGIFGSASKRKAQEIIAKYAPKPTTTVDKELEACAVQADWMKDSTYKWESHPTIEKSKKCGTCVTYVACVLQRINYLKSGEYIWHDNKGKVIGANDKMVVTYPKSKKLSQIKSELKAGDIVLDGDKSDVGSGSHIFIVTGKWDGDKPIIWDNHSGQQKKGAYAYSRNRSVIAYVRLK